MDVLPTPDTGGRREFEGALVRFLDDEAGARKTESQRAARTVFWFAVSCAVLSVGYGSFYALAPTNLRTLAIISALGILAYAVIAVLARTGHQLIASVMVMAIATLQIMMFVSALGWESGLHLFLVATGVVVFMVFTERQRAYRWIFVVLSACVFVWCQMRFSSEAAPIQLSAAGLGTLFSVNAVITAILVYGMSAISYYRSVQSRTQAAVSTARAEYLANTDALTGLANRRPVMDILDSLSAPTVGDYSVAVADLDRFKDLNDSFGHACGDQVLSAVGELLRTHAKARDALGRWGGEEFIFVMPGTNIAEATARMEAMREMLASTPIPCGDHVHSITVSVGVADGRGDGASHRVVQRADHALYDAKVAGRNCVCVQALADTPATAALQSIAGERRLTARRDSDRKRRRKPL